MFIVLRKLQTIASKFTLSRHLKIHTKLLVSYSIILALISSAFFYVMIQMNTLGTIHEQGYNRSENALQFRTLTMKADDKFNLITAAIANHDLVKAKNDAGHVRTEIRTLETEIKAIALQMKGIAVSEEEKAHADVFIARYAEFVTAIDNLLMYLENNPAPDYGMIAVYQSEVTGIREQANNEIIPIMGSLTERSKAEFQYFLSVKQNAGLSGGIIFIIGVICAVLISLFVTVSINTPIIRLLTELV